MGPGVQVDIASLSRLSRDTPPRATPGRWAGRREGASRTCPRPHVCRICRGTNGPGPRAGDGEARIRDALADLVPAEGQANRAADFGAVLGQPAGRGPHARGLRTETKNGPHGKAGIRRRARSGVRRDVDGRGHPQSGSDRCRSDGSAPPDARCRRHLQGREESAGHPCAGRHSLRGHRAAVEGPTALAWAPDPVAVAKTAVDYAKSNDKLVVVGGALGARSLDLEGCRALAALPSLITLRAGLVGMIATPATRMAGVLQGRPASLPGSSAPSPGRTRQAADRWQPRKRQVGESGLNGTDQGLD